jgi:hypothetical protein
MGTWELGIQSTENSSYSMTAYIFLGSDMHDDDMHDSYTHIYTTLLYIHFMHKKTETLFVMMSFSSNKDVATVPLINHHK